ncbi:hypothetical protein [Micrococcus sp. FDAARGOS_333]|uniref:hypothetical protein n=1 Tax=Micrococcus sp. FDAARGOS_333 TaxID=1930558 RepID=UPI000B4E4DC8|nr:hypothetical protein [Micrococcus sp. FDAARGOS_333]PNL17299.1 hypothetical protein CEQ11_003345 [Micrococcus sp. FDAARGOS_333]
MTNTLDAELAAIRKEAREKAEKARARAAAEQAKVDAEVLRLLREEQPDGYANLARRARRALADKAEARRRARAESKARREAEKQQTTTSGQWPASAGHPEERSDG